MSPIIDIATLIGVSGIYYFILFILLLLFWRQNRDIEAIIWWCGFPFFRLINSLISSDSVDYDYQFIVYLGNIAILLSDTFLMVGCLKFAKLPINWKIIYTYVGLFICLCIYQHLNSADLADRTRGIIVFTIIPMTAAIYALSRLGTQQYGIEKLFTIFWIGFQIAIFIFWTVINFDFNNPDYVNTLMIALALTYLCHIFVAIGLIILTIAEQRNKLLLDIDVNQELEQNLEYTLQQAQLANEEKNQFLSNMSHELRTPLNTINGYAESLRLGLYGPLSDKQKEYVQNIYSGGELLLRLITDLLNLSDVEEGKVDIHLEELNLNQLFIRTLPLLEEIVDKKSNRLRINNRIEKLSEPSAVNVDQIRTKQILINFVSNAVKYSENNTPITIDISEIGDHFFRITVSDEGIGISEDNYENIFLPFNRAGIEGDEVEGIGVGLSIAKTLIEEMNGNIGFASELGKGSSFWIDIPKSKQRQLPIG